MWSTTRHRWLDHVVVTRAVPVTLHYCQAAMVTIAFRALQENLIASSPDNLDDALTRYS